MICLLFEKNLPTDMESASPSPVSVPPYSVGIEGHLEVTLL
jgi:hypothetical protein